MSEYNVPRRIKKGTGAPKKTSNKINISGNLILQILLFTVAAMLAGIIVFNSYLASLPPITNLSTFKPNLVTKFYSADGEIIKTFTAYTYSKAELKDIPEKLIQAIISTEDKNFYSHKGYDLSGLARSMVANILAGHVVQGASTITQQLSRILFLSNEKTFNRKIKEFVIASQIEKTLDKGQILEMYLNNVYLGSGAYGVQGAARIYFNKELSELTLSEIALIAGLPQAPSVYSPFNNLELARKRRNMVLKRMYKMRYIDKATYKQAKEEEIKLSEMPSLYVHNRAPYFCDFVMKELEKLGFTEDDIVHGGYRITTTLDYKTQVKMNEAIVKQLNAWGLKGDKNQAAAFSFSPVDGRIIAYAGGKDYTKTQYDRVTQAVRPPGSAFKPFVYAAALEKGVKPNDMIDDLPFKAGKWTPKNYGNKYRGEIPVYTALMISSNVCAARLIQYAGIRSVIQLARVMGITTPLEYDYTIALGSNGVKLYEMTRAYGVFANGGYKVEPYGIQKIESSRGKVLYEAPQTRKYKVLSEDTASDMTTMMKTVILYGTGAAANIGKPAAAKTGTTDDYRDACFIGYTPDVVTGVWVGNDDNSRMPGLTGGTVPALIWKDIMIVATQPYGNRDFEYVPIQLKQFKITGAKFITPEEVKKGFEKKEKKEEEIRLNGGIDPEAEETLEGIKIFKPFDFGNKNDNQTEKVKKTSTDNAKQIQKNKEPVKEVQMAPVPMATPSDLIKTQE
ncbi:PBP1A family penicillin-binding protein [bacterium]|nr:PBP1A family penicillin-binding protein [bacterium]